MTPASTSPAEQHEQQLPTVYQTIIIGAGPCGLALAARLRENTPSALYTDEEHRRFHWLRQHSAHSAVKDRKTGKVKCPANSTTRPSAGGLLCLDSEGGGWMAKWKRLFGTLQIERLRSPMFFHPDPGDRDALRAFAHEEGREAELMELGGCVGKEISKHRKKKGRRERYQTCIGSKAPNTVNERERSDYYTPSAELFEDFCDTVIERYGLHAPGLVQQARVEHLAYGALPQLSSSEDLFTVRTTRSVFYARAVALAVGPGETPSIPPPFASVPDGARESLTAVLANTAHTSLIPPSSPLAIKLRISRRTTAAVIGGGLTSAQVSDLCLQSGVSEIWHMMRGPLKVKPFDVDLSWMGKFRNQEKAAFWMADSDAERAEMLAAARGGGSVTPGFAKVLQKHTLAGRLRLRTHTVVSDARYDVESGMWTLITDPPTPDLPAVDHVFLATGSATPFSKLPYLQTLLVKYPLESEAGLPALTDDLQWTKDVPLFVTGKFASLRLGPGAGNLEGARAGAERIALALQKMGIGGDLHDRARRDSGYGEADEGVDTERGTEKKGRGGRERYVQGFANRFEMLGA